MRRVFSFIFFFSFILSYNAFSQKQGELTQPRILILLDESSSMVNQWSGSKARYQAADEIILRLMDSIYSVNNQVEFSLRAFGHQHTVQENDCSDTKNEVMFSKDNRTQMSLRLADLHPLGVTPIAFSLQEAAENDLVDEQHYAYSIILITDGGESCGGDICEVVKTLIAKKVYFKPYIVSLVDYAPLKTEYACLGDYLQVTSEQDVPKAVGDIVTAYRPMLTLTQQDYKLIQTVLANPPSVLKVNIPTIEVPVQEPKVQEPKVTEAPIKKQPIPEVKPTPPAKPVVKDTTKPKPKIVAAPPKQATPPPATHIVVQENTQPYPKQTVTRIPVLKVQHIPSLYVLDRDDDIHKVKVPAFPIRKPEPVVPPPVASVPPLVVNKPVVHKPVAKAVPKPKPETKPKTGKKPLTNEIETKEVTANIVKEPAKETTVAVYFRDENGKYYSSTPQILMIDLHTLATVKKFYRTTDENGNPDHQNVPAGTYNVTVAGGTNLLVRNVVVQENQNTKITIPVTNGSLKFSYESDPNRPVTEFTALVAERKDYGGKTVKQKCTMELSYEPGNYFIEVNTLPPFRRNVDLDFNSEYDIRIPDPGYVQFTNQNKTGRVTLYCVLGDSYANFFSFEANGDLSGQKIQLLPGPYQAHFKNPKLPYAPEVVVPFNVKSNQVTEVELK